MFERFTSEARRSLELASQLAVEQGSPAISAEHLLAALADHASGLAGALLAERGIDRPLAEGVLPPATGGGGARTPPFTPGAKKALELSLREALNLAHDHIGSGHLLLGLLRLDEGASAALLRERGVDIEDARAEVRVRSEGARLGGRRRPRRTGRIVEPPTAHEQARAAAAASPPADDDLVTLAREPGSRLQRALASLGVSTEELEAALAEVASDPDDGPVELDLGAGASLHVAAGARAADLRALLAAAGHVAPAEGGDGPWRLEQQALGDAVWATLEGWLNPSP